MVKRSPFLAMLAAGMLGGGVTAAALLGTGVAGENDGRTVITSSSLGAGPSRASDRQSALSARDIYTRARPNYHPIATTSLDAIVLKRSR